MTLVLLPAGDTCCRAAPDRSTRAEGKCTNAGRRGDPADGLGEVLSESPPPPLPPERSFIKVVPEKYLARAFPFPDPCANSP